MYQPMESVSVFFIHHLLIMSFSPLFYCRISEFYQTASNQVIDVTWQIFSLHSRFCSVHREGDLWMCGSRCLWHALWHLSVDISWQEVLVFNSTGGRWHSLTLLQLCFWLSFHTNSECHCFLLVKGARARTHLSRRQWPLLLLLQVYADSAVVWTR